MAELTKVELAANAIRRDCSRRMMEQYNQMINLINQEVIPTIVRKIRKNFPSQQGRVVMPNDSEKICWELSNDSTCVNGPGHWLLFTVNGDIVSSRQQIKDGLWIYDSMAEPALLDVSFQMSVWYPVSLFDGLMFVGKQCLVSQAILSSWKLRFDMMLAEYVRAQEERRYKTW